ENNRGVAGDGSTSAAFMVTSFWGGIAPDVNIEDNTIKNNLFGVLVGYDDNDVSQVEISNNKFIENVVAISNTYSTENHLDIGGNVFTDNERHGFGLLGSGVPPDTLHVGKTNATDEDNLCGNPAEPCATLQHAV